MAYLIHEANQRSRDAFNVFRLFGGHRRDTQKEVLTKIEKAMISERVHPSHDSPQTRDQKKKNYNRLEALRRLFEIPHAREVYHKSGLLPLMKICRDLNYRRLEDAFPSILEIAAFFKAQGLVPIEPELVLSTLLPSDQRTAEEREFADSLAVYKAREEAEVEDSDCCIEEPVIAEITRKRPPSPLILAERRELQKRKRSSKQASCTASSGDIEGGGGKAMGSRGHAEEQREKGEGQEDLGEEMTQGGRVQKHGEKQLEANEVDRRTKGRERGQTVGERQESGGGGGQPVGERQESGGGGGQPDVGGGVPSETIGEQEESGERSQPCRPSGAGGSFALNEQGRMAQSDAKSDGGVTEEKADSGGRESVGKAVKYALKGIQEDSSSCLDRINLLATGIEVQTKEIEVKNGQIASLKESLAQLDMDVKTLTELKQKNVNEEKVQRDKHAQLNGFAKALEDLLK